MGGWITAYASVVVAFTSIDAAWIHLVMRDRFVAALGDQLLSQPRYGAVIMFYLLYPLGIVLLAASDAVRAGTCPRLAAAARGALLGACSYGAYDLTNHATLAAWPLAIVVPDMAWGVALTAFSAIIAVVVLQAAVEIRAGRRAGRDAERSARR